MASQTPPVELSAASGADLLIDLLPTMAWTVTPQGKVDFVNQQCCVFTGLSREHLLGDGMKDCIHPDDQVIRWDHQQASPYEHELRVRRHDGEYIRCLLRTIPLLDGAGQVIKWIGTTTDIEEVRRAADRLIQEEHLQLALDSADVGIWRLKLPSYELTVDERTRRHLDLDRNVIEGYRPQDYIHPHDFAHSANETPDANGRLLTEHRVRQRDGSYRWQAIHWRRWFEGEGTGTGTGEDGMPMLITGTSMDITARKEAEAEREELAQRYRIALAAAELGTLSCDLEQRLTHLDDRARTHLSGDHLHLTFEQCLS
jgi:PAS domain S-box-containing protein